MFLVYDQSVMRGLIFHIFLLSLVVSNLAFAQYYGEEVQKRAEATRKNWCKPGSIPKVTINTDTDRISWVYNRSQKNLNKADIDTVNPYGNNVITDVGGLMHGGIKMEERMQFGTLTNPNTNETCMFYNSVDISFHIFPTIYIASEYPPGTCMHNAIKAHELKHINVDRQIVNKYAKAVGKAVQTEIAKRNVYGPLPSSNQKALGQQMKLQMEQILRMYSDAMDAERRQLQQAVDSLQEYERVNKSCKS